MCFEEGRRMTVGLVDEVGIAEEVLVDVAVDTVAGTGGIAGTAGTLGSLAEW